MIQYHKKHREISLQRSKLILTKEISVLHFNNPLHYLGKYTFHKLVKYVDWDTDDIKDHRSTFNKPARKLDTMMIY